MSARLEPPDHAVRRTLKTFLDADHSRLGDVYRLSEQGLAAHQIASELGVGSSGFVSNYRAIIRALLDGQLPTGPSMARQVTSAVNRIAGDGRIGSNARAYLLQLLEALAEVAGGQSRQQVSQRRTPPASPPAPGSNAREHSLRDQVADELRRRTREVVAGISGQTDIEPDDYNAVVAAESPLDALHRLLQDLATSRTTRSLHAAGRLELSLEAAVLGWTDLPLTADLIEAARGRLDYWRTS
ncbi:hypothetical protein J2X46_001244 [Nocardioides sp. BE266]|uniref:hypothetical protein n=1 Tax=Nocardioides sp. BE266 TaxID=2817725 RepID=UPI002856E798|nr:hypothetical protein [Nocardioides sp. BE266]MDR7252268.1 hypothetical protein [Nocardioides sp. BE266]